MGNILSSNTIYAVAYLTDLGRNYLFDPINSGRFTVIPGTGQMIDAFKITYFSLSDPDYNYNVTSGYPFESGDVPDVSGKNSDCIKGAVINEEVNLVSVNGEVSGISGVSDDDDTPTTTVPYILQTDDSDNNVVIPLNDLDIITE